MSKGGAVVQEKRIPLRKCVGCGEMIGKKGAVRVVRGKEGNISVDLKGKEPGRGAYICRDLNCLELAVKGKKLERSLKCRIPDEIYDSIKKELNANQ